MIYLSFAVSLGGLVALFFIITQTVGNTQDRYAHWVIDPRDSLAVRERVVSACQAAVEQRLLYRGVVRFQKHHLVAYSVGPPSREVYTLFSYVVVRQPLASPAQRYFQCTVALDLKFGTSRLKQLTFLH
jgi:hypothetical protein